MSLITPTSSTVEYNILGSKRHIFLLLTLSILLFTAGVISGAEQFSINRVSSSINVNFDATLGSYFLAVSAVAWAAYSLGRIVPSMYRMSVAPKFLATSSCIVMGWYALLTYPYQTSMLVALAIVALERCWVFARAQKTYAGFIAGLVLSIGTFMWTQFAVVTIVICIFGAIVAHLSTTRRLGVGISTALVIGFPTVCTILCSLYINWRFDQNLAWFTPLFEVIKLVL